MSEKREGKVIPFKAKGIQPTYKSREALATDLKTTAAGTMAFILLLVVSFNFSFFQKESEVEKQMKINRGLASLKTSTLQMDLQKNLATLHKEMIVQQAKKPTAADSLIFGPLAGKYSIITDHGLVKKISLNDTTGEATLVRDRLEFIETNSAALAPGLNSIRKVSVHKNPDGKKEIYQVQTVNGESRFEFTIGEQNQLISLTVE